MQPAWDQEWDAGEIGCGELVLLLRKRLLDLTPGKVLRLHALDGGAPEDIPSWCRIMGHALVHSQPPYYFIQRKLED